jgi:hypothetical protein
MVKKTFIAFPGFEPRPVTLVTELCHGYIIWKERMKSDLLKILPVGYTPKGTAVEGEVDHMKDAMTSSDLNRRPGTVW